MKVVLMLAPGESDIRQQNVAKTLDDAGYEIEEVVISNLSDHDDHTPQCAAINEALRHATDELRDVNQEYTETVEELREIQDELEDLHKFLGMDHDPRATRTLAVTMAEAMGLSLEDDLDDNPGALTIARKLMESPWMERHEVTVSQAFLKDMNDADVVVVPLGKPAPAGDVNLQEPKGTGLGWPKNEAPAEAQ